VIVTPARIRGSRETCLPRSAPARAATPAKQPPVAATPLTPQPHNLFAGTSGWAYPTWKPGFYPANLRARSFLSFYATQVSSVEVNYTFRMLPTEKQLQGWLDAVPAGFRFSFKAPQRITHFQRLRGCSEQLAAFFAALEPARTAGKLGVLLFQLPPNFAADNDRLAAFLDDAHAASGATLQLAFEFRHTSWCTDGTFELLRSHNAALCVAESDDLATPDVATANVRCYRLRRSGGYAPAELTAFAERFHALAASGPVYVYFKHEDDPTGALNAQAMLQQAATLTAGAR
jgi:uncharacterized protein YecE (DUF72 family)